MLDNNKCILVYNLTKEELEKLNKKADLKLIVVTDDMAEMKVKDIVEGIKILNYNNRMPNEKLILFNNYDEKGLVEAIKDIRSFIKGGIIAVVTETTINWTFEYLLNHMIEERQWIAMQSRKEERN
ncbi:MAG: DUF3783 domain-containing protein [Clostridiaceae bacterium]|nr:DUF3783 domain-containing protein [Clostridiaceae bacterium]